MTPQSNPSATAVVIGGGVIGLSAAYHLSQKRFGRVILLEKAVVGDGSSSRSGGIITGLLWSKTGILACKTSLALYEQLSTTLEPYGYRYQDVGCLNLFDGDSWDERKPLLSLYDELGAPFEIIDSDEMRKRWPDLAPAEGLMGLFDPLGGYSEPHEYVPALAQFNRDAGVEIRQGQTVTGILEKNGRVRGVMTVAGPVEADVVICTVHTWTMRLLANLGWKLPMKSFVHQRYVTRPLPDPVRIPAVNANPYEGYVRPHSGNRILVGGETANREEYEVPSFDFRMNELAAPPALKDQLYESFVPLVPRLGQTGWETEHVGLLSFSMDGEPILGEAPALPGLFVGASFHSGGFAYNPVAGQLLAELAADGRTHIDISAFSPDRYGREETEAYLSRTLAQKDAVQRRH